MDITLPIWPAARRCIHTKNPMISSTGRSRPAMLSSQLLPGVLNSRSTFFSRIVASSAAARLRSPPPVVVNVLPLLRCPVMTFDELLTVIDLTWPDRTSSMNWVYEILSELPLGHRLGSTRASATTARSTHIVQRGQLPGRRTPSPPPPGGVGRLS